jgi:hypothetical protein
VIDAPEPSFVDELLRKSDRRDAPIIVPDHVRDLGALDRPGHAGGLRRVAPERLLAHDHLARRDSRQRDFGVHVVGGGDVDEINVAARDKPAPAGLAGLVDAAIEEHEFQITVADGKHQIPSHGPKNHLGCELAPLKQLPRPIPMPARSFPTQSYRNSVSSEVCNRTVVFAERVRTAIGAFGGTLKDVPAPDLGAVAIRAAVERAGLKPDEIETAAMGNVVQAGAKMNPARQAAVQAGLPVTVPAMTVNRVCGSGAQAIVSAAQEILLGNANAAVAGGMENMDQAPYLVQRGRWGYRLGDGQLYDSVLRDGLNDAFSSYRYKSRHFLDKIRNLYQYSYCRNRLTRSQPGEESSRLFENLTGPQPRARAEGRRRFPYFYRP